VKGYVPDEDKREGDPGGEQIGPFPPKARPKNKEASKAAIGKRPRKLTLIWWRGSTARRTRTSTSPRPRL
jgi:hypothetical protein